MRDAEDTPAPERPFRLALPAEGAARRPVIFASPHSGRFYPPDMAPAASLAASAIRRSEDALVDELLAAAPRHGFALICATYGRAYVDVNRAPDELDLAMFHDAPPGAGRTRTARVAAGLGSIPRLAGEGRAIYDRKLGWNEGQARLAAVHQPYHDALQELARSTLQAWGVAVLFDWHSMPSAAVKGAAGPGPDFVLGDRFGASCAGAVTALVERELKAMGFAVARNAPYAGGFTTEAYGNASGGLHALQIEVNRRLYLDEATMLPHDGFKALAESLERLFRALAAQEWGALSAGAQKNRARGAR
ncbi:MAG TPA: N-formylglutamate amidohydrolase [Caulobacteraceae bacterium]